jgi:hypothetical protein
MQLDNGGACSVSARAPLLLLQAGVSQGQRTTLAWHGGERSAAD